MTGTERAHSNTRKPVEQPAHESPETDSPEQDASLPSLEQGKLDRRLLTLAGILQLQRTIGNEAVMRLIADHQEPTISAAASHQKQIQRVEGTLIKATDKLKVGTKVTILKPTYPTFQIQDIETKKTYWIQGAVKDYFAADPTEKSSDESPVKTVVVKAEPPPEKVVEEVSQPPALVNGGSSVEPKISAPSLDKGVKKDPTPSKESVPTPKQIAEVQGTLPSAKKKVSGPSLTDRLNAGDYPTMGRIQDPTWDIIEPLLDDYGTFTVDQKAKMKKKLETSPLKPRGIPDLIDMTFPYNNSEKLKATVTKVKKDLADAAPDLETWRESTSQKTTRGARGDTRQPHEVQESGGLFGWDAGIVTLSHAKSIIRSVMGMTEQEQSTWIAKWKWPTPDRKEANPWVATGIGKEGGQKGGGEFVYELPLIFHEADDQPMVIATDTEDLETASVIGVRLEEKGDEVVMLTGIPWKYVTHWSGSLEGKPPELHDANAAAAATKKLAKK